MNPKDGVPAFPVPKDYDEQGMTLRDWFAGQALTALMAKSGDEFGYDELASFSYCMADAMLKAREVK